MTETPLAAHITTNLSAQRNRLNRPKTCVHRWHGIESNYCEAVYRQTRAQAENGSVLALNNSSMQTTVAP